MRPRLAPAPADVRFEPAPRAFAMWNLNRLLPAPSLACADRAVWKVTVEADDAIVVAEQRGASCCGGVPNCFLKTHKMTRVDENTWSGTLGCKPITLTRKTDTECYHITTDGPMIMTRE